MKKCDKKAYMKEYRSTPEYREKQKIWRENNGDEVKKFNKQFYQKNKKREKARAKKWREDNIEICLKRDKLYRDNPLNTEKIKTLRKKWGEKNIELVRLSRRISGSKRRALTRGSLADITLQEINKLIEDSNNICFWCDEGTDIMHLDHIYPLSKGGGHTISNLCVSCVECNLRKGAKDPEVWLEEILRETIKEAKASKTKNK